MMYDCQWLRFVIDMPKGMTFNNLFHAHPTKLNGNSEPVVQKSESEREFVWPFYQASMGDSFIIESPSLRLLSSPNAGFTFRSEMYGTRNVGGPRVTIPAIPGKCHEDCSRSMEARSCR